MATESSEVARMVATGSTSDEVLWIFIIIIITVFAVAGFYYLIKFAVKNGIVAAKRQLDQEQHMMGRQEL